MKPRAMARGQLRPMSEINVVPYIDVMLVLLVVFMVATPLLNQGVEVELPNAFAKPLEQQQEDPLIVSIKANGKYFMNFGDEPAKAVSKRQLQKQIRLIIKRKPETQVLVWGDRKVAYGAIVKLMVMLQQAGVPNVGLVTEEDA